MKFNRRLYPENWSDLAASVKQEAKWHCQKCGLKCIAPGEDTSKLTRSERMKRTLQTHHCIALTELYWLCGSIQF
ncbi:hypothetical protein AMR41_11060, partial [Hapalosiphon sp. MRB220]